jgi:RNA polymerase sigma-70 factor (ECF subfamily)
MSPGDDVARTIEAVFREESARIIAGLVRISRDFDLAEDAVQDAFASATDRWLREGIPPNPAGWITLTARRKAIDRLRRERLFGEKLLVLERLSSTEAAETYEPADDYSIHDDRLRLIFTCCHPALAIESQVALTLRTVCGLSTPKSRARSSYPKRRSRNGSSAPSEKSATPGFRIPSRRITCSPNG